MSKPRIPRRWFCKECEQIWRDAVPPCIRTHTVYRLCGYRECPKILESPQLTCCDAHGVLAARIAYGLTSRPSAPHQERIGGDWLFRERLRLGLSRGEVADVVGRECCHPASEYVLEVHDRQLPPGWMSKLAQAGFEVDAQQLAPSALPARWLEEEVRRRGWSPLLLPAWLGLTAGELAQMVAQEQTLPRCFLPRLREMCPDVEPAFWEAASCPIPPNGTPAPAAIPIHPKSCNAEEDSTMSAQDQPTPTFRLSLTVKADAGPPACSIRMQHQGDQLDTEIDCNAGYVTSLQTGGILRRYMEQLFDPLIASLQPKGEKQAAAKE